MYPKIELGLKMKKVLLIAFVLWATPVFAQTNESPEVLTEKIDRLERDLSLLQKQLYAGTNASASDSVRANVSPDQTDDLYSRLTSQDTLIRELTAQVEKQSFDLAQANEKIMKLNADVEARFRMMETAPTPAVTQATPALATDKPAVAPVVATPATGSDKAAYEAAYELLKKGDHVGAEQAFLAFIKSYPKSDLAGNANYWLGETYFARGQYEQAVGIFAEGFTTYKNNSKASDNLLKLGITMNKLGKKNEACTAFSSLPKEFPKAAQSLKDRAKSEAKKASCP